LHLKWQLAVAETAPPSVELLPSEGGVLISAVSTAARAGIFFVNKARHAATISLGRFSLGSQVFSLAGYPTHLTKKKFSASRQRTSRSTVNMASSIVAVNLGNNAERGVCHYE
jgi:hypothetical protein